MSRLRVGVLFGGRSTEHEVSILSAQSIITAMDPQRFLDRGTHHAVDLRLQVEADPGERR